MHNVQSQSYRRMCNLHLFADIEKNMMTSKSMESTSWRPKIYQKVRQNVKQYDMSSTLTSSRQNVGHNVKKVWKVCHDITDTPWCLKVCQSVTRWVKYNNMSKSTSCYQKRIGDYSISILPKIGVPDWPAAAILQYKFKKSWVDLKWWEMQSTLIYGLPKWPPADKFCEKNVKQIKLRIDLKWPDIRSKVIFGQPMWLNRANNR